MELMILARTAETILKHVPFDVEKIHDEIIEGFAGFFSASLDEVEKALGRDSESSNLLHSQEFFNRYRVTEQARFIIAIGNDVTQALQEEQQRLKAEGRDYS